MENKSAVEKMMEDNTRVHVEKLSKKYNFNLKEAIKLLNIDKKEGMSKGSREIILPYCGEIDKEWCNGVRLNYGLYSQCMNDKDKKTGYCKTCSRQGEKNGTGIPTYGTIQERAKAGNTYRDEHGKK